MTVADAERPEINFRRVPGGWLFRAPAPWIVGAAPHYLVDEQQKHRITAILKPRYPKLIAVAVVAAIIGWAVAVPLMMWAVSGHPDPTPLDIVLMVPIIVLPMLIALWAFSTIQRRRLAPILAGAQRSAEQITYAEMRAVTERAMTPRQARVLAIASAVACMCFVVVVVSNLMVKHTLLAPQPLLFTCLLVMNAWQALRWFRISRKSSSPQS